MGKDTAIAWTDHTFNSWWGCTRISPGCEHCYAESWDRRWGGDHWGQQAPRRMFGDAHWREPLAWDAAAERDGVRRRVFCASMGDVFEDRRDLDEPRARLWALIGETPHLDWLLLTKRPRAGHLVPTSWLLGCWPGNAWLGVTAEDQHRADERIPVLLSCPAPVRFVSVEPLLGPLDFSAFFGGPYVGLPGDVIIPNHNEGIDWVIPGGESGSSARPCNVQWIRDVVRQCRAARVACFVKQMGSLAYDPDQYDYSSYGVPPIAGHLNYRHPKGGDPSEWPEDLRVREIPEVTS